jgi:putative nucleotidyltransferase with HDIG domain
VNPEQPYWWQRISRHDLLAIILLILTSMGVYAVLVLPLSLRPSTLLLRAGQVAPQDFQAPRSIEYISSVRTEQAREIAERSVVQTYSLPDPTIARRQIELLRTALENITTTRADPALTSEQKKAALAALSDLRLQPATSEGILALSDTRWNSIAQDALRVLEQVMRSPVRDTNIKTIRSNIEFVVSLALTEDQATIVVELVTPFIVANSFSSPELTDTARAEARQLVEPITQTYVEGEIVVQRGQLLADADIEALEILGLIRPTNPTLDYLGLAALVAVVMGFVGIYFHRRRPTYYNESRSLILVAVLFLGFLAFARLVIPNRIVLPYLFPLPAFGMLIATLFGPGGGMILSLVASLLAAYGLPNALDLTLFYLLASLTGVLTLGRAHRIGSFLWAGLASAVAGMAVITAYRLPPGTLDPLGYLTLIGAALLNGVASASLALMLQYFLAEFLGLTTALRLLEIARPDAPLLKYFLRNAPGTYQHSLQVANLAEQAAEKLGMDTLLVRVGALYHDVGKAANPSFFIENQMPGSLNPHDDLDPETAAATVTRHVLDSIVLARKHRLPRRLQDFMLEHHGTMLARYYYNAAVQAAGGDASKVDAEKFRYPGPRPRTRETALLMLADNVEARARSERPRNEKEVRAVVQKAIDYCQAEGQLADTRFTLKDLTIITDVFTVALTGLYHPRIQYPGSGPHHSDHSAAHTASAPVDEPAAPVHRKAGSKPARR